MPRHHIVTFFVAALLASASGSIAQGQEWERPTEAEYTDAENTFVKLMPNVGNAGVSAIKRIRDVEDVLLRGAFDELTRQTEALRSLRSNDGLTRELEERFVRTLVAASTADFYLKRHFSLLLLRHDALTLDMRLRKINYANVLVHLVFRAKNQVWHAILDPPQKADKSYWATSKRVVLGLERLLENELPDLLDGGKSLIEQGSDLTKDMLIRLKDYVSTAENLSRLHSAYKTMRLYRLSW